MVEGPSEVRALETSIATLADAADASVEVRFQIMCDRHRMTRTDKEGGDITSKLGVNPDNICHVIEKTFLTPFCRTTGLYPRDINQVVQIVDVDGCFVPDDRVVQAPQDQVGVVYRDDCILASDVKSIIRRNAQKQANIRKLISLSEIKADSKVVPYQVYFFSSNLDHFLHGDANLDQDHKVLRAGDFSDECVAKPSLFLNKMQEDDCYSDYTTSWETVQSGYESLRPHSNLGVFLDRFTM